MPLRNKTDKGWLRSREFWTEDIPRHAGNVGAGLLTGGVGGLVDAVAGPLQYAGLVGDRPVGGSRWWGDQLAADVDSPSYLVGSLASPDPFAEIALGSKALGLGAGMVAKQMAARPRSAIDEHGRLQAGHFDEQKGTRANREAFSRHLEEARGRMDPQDAAQVDPLPSDFSGRLFALPGGEAGFAIDDAGTLTNLFRHPDAPISNTMEAALIKGRAAGGRNLEAFDTYLAEGYKRRGAVETGRLGFDPRYAPEGWDEAIMGRPDYVSMEIGGYVPERKHSLHAGPREQRPLERLATPRGEPPAIAEAFSGGRVGRLNRLTRRGLDMGADRWYWMGGLKDRFIEALGDAEGARRFDMFMDQVAAHSPRSKVDANLKRASYGYQRQLQGLPIDVDQSLYPAGYGHLAHKTQLHGLRRLAETGVIGTGTEQPKIISFAENLKGNYAPMTVDSHNNLIVTGRAGSPTGAQYPHLEARQARLASNMGLDPAEWQSALWTGAGDITGVADSRNMTAMFNQRLARTAEELNMSEEEAFKAFARGDTRLYQALLPVLGLGAAAGVLSSEEGVPES